MDHSNLLKIGSESNYKGRTLQPHRHNDHYLHHTITAKVASDATKGNQLRINYLSQWTRSSWTLMCGCSKPTWG